MTGRYPHRTGGIDTLEARGLDRLRLDERTLADVLGGAGYATALIGKWHNGALDRRYHPTARGFQEFVGFQGGWNPYYRYRLDRNCIIEYGDKDQYLTDVFSDAAVDFIERNRRGPFFMQLAYNAPHFHLEAPDAIAQKYAEMGFSVGVSLLYAMIEVMDAGIGRIADKLDELGIADNTILMFTSDNGPGAGRLERLFAAALQLQLQRRQRQYLRRRHPRAHDRPLAGRLARRRAQRCHGAFQRLVPHAAKPGGRRCAGRSAA